MKKMLKISIIGAIFSLALVGCGSSNSASKDDGKLIVGATSVPHAEILNEVVDDLANEGITLEVKEFSEYTLLNPSLSSGEIDANFFQHSSYLNNYTQQTGEKLKSIGAVHTEPMGIYSKKIKSLDELKDGDKVAIPNDATNGSRALLLLESNGLIKLKEGALDKATLLDVVENPKNIEILEMDAASLPRTLDEVAISVINTNYALEAGLNPTKDALAIESSDSPFANIVVVREGDENREDIKALYKALTSEEMKKFIEDKYQGAIIPAF